MFGLQKLVCLHKRKVPTLFSHEIKSTLRYQSKLEKCLDDLRKDAALSNACSKLRTNRPTREKDFGPDKIDELLENERVKQSFLKKKLQELLQSTIAQVNELVDSKDQLQTVIEEREKVLHLINISNVNVDFRKKLKKKQAIVVEGKKEEDYNDDVDTLACYTDAADEALVYAKHVKVLAKNIRKLIRETIEDTKAEQKAIHIRIKGRGENFEK